MNAGAVCAKYGMSASSALSASPDGDLLYMHEVRLFLGCTFIISSRKSVNHASMLHRSSTKRREQEMVCAASQ